MSPYKSTISLILSWNFIMGAVNCETIICGLGTECNCNPVMDPPEPCSLKCNSVDVCKGSSLNCRAGDACSVVCQGYASCSEAIIQSNTATNVSITCDGTDSCKDVMAVCGSGDCALQCHTYESCMGVLSINTTLANSFQCSGICDAEGIPPPSAAALSSTRPTTSPTSSPIITSTTLPTEQPSFLPTSTAISSTSGPTSLSTSNPTSTPSSQTITSLSPQPSGTTQSSSSTVVRTKNPTVDERNRRVDASTATTSYLSTQILFEEEPEIRYVAHYPKLGTLCYLVIGVASFIVTCVCLTASALVYLNHKNTQQILLAATQTQKANLQDKNQNRCHFPPPIPSVNQFQTPSIMINPYHVPSIMNQVPYTPHNMTPNMNALTPNFTAMTPVIRQTVSAISVNNDAMSQYEAHEGTETHVNRRQISDIPALPHVIGADTAAPYQHVRQRASIHMTPGGYMDEEFVTKKRKTTHEIMPGKAPVRSPTVLRNHSNANSIANSPVNTAETNHITLEVLNLGEQDMERKDVDVDDIHIEAPDVAKKQEPESVESNTEDLSRELFTTHSDSHSRNVSHDVVPNRAIWYRYHQVGSLPVINAAAVQSKVQSLDRAQSAAVLMRKKREEDIGEPLQLPSLVHNHLVPPTDTESTYNSDVSDPRPDADADPIHSNISYKNHTQVEDGDSYGKLHPLQGEIEQELTYDDDFESDDTRITNSVCANKSADDTDAAGDDDTYFEMKPLVESSMHTEQTEYDSTVSSFPIEDESETSIAKDCNTTSDSIILQHAYTLMQLLSNDTTEQERRRSSISFGV